MAQAVITVASAVVLGVGTLIASGAAEEWQTAVREEVQRDAALVETVRHVYLVEAPHAYQLAALEARAAALAEASGGAPATLQAEALAAAAAADQLVAVEGQAGLASGAYRLPDGGFDVQGRLADLRADDPDLVALDPLDSLARGDARRTAGLLVASLVIPLVAGYLLVRALLAAGHRTGPAHEDVGLVPQPWDAVPQRRPATALALVAWVAISLLPFEQLALSLAEQRAQAESSRNAVNLTSALQASGALSVFQGEVERDALIQEALAITRVEVSLREVPVASEALAGQAAVGEAEYAAVETVREVGARMSRPPSAADGVDPFAVSMTTSFGLSLVASEAMQEAMQAQADQADAAASYGRRANLASLALLLAALALSVATLAGTATDRSGRWVKDAAGTLLVLTSVVAVVALVV